MNLPAQFKSLAFWKGASFLVAGVLALLVVFGVLPAQYAIDAGTILAFALSILHFFDINPELRARGLMK